eukprot:TRINITY_DN1026_c0_g1_i1.p1 TRINITY_DN1026_c0_g1~~TRINITY_DN1026_c0_g1_i1.p1  ORF type:complete len:992 (+),score=183.22 TRINITY_DN1026_c0_g1_i1:122-3097(+)
MSKKDVEIGEGDVLAYGQIMFRRDIKEKWQKVEAKLKNISNLHALRLSSLNDDSITLDTITITKDLVTIGPIPSVEKGHMLQFHLANSRKQVHLASQKTSVVFNWLNVIECVAETKRDPSKYISEEFLRQKIASQIDGLESMTTRTTKISQTAKQLAKNARGLSDSSLLLQKKTVDSLLEKVSDKRDKIIHELIQTEQTYLKSLYTLNYVYRQPMKKVTKELYLTEDQLNTIFGNLDAITKVNQKFLESLITKFKDWTPTDSISPIIKTSLPEFKSYFDYSINFKESTTLCDDLKKNSIEFKSFCDAIAEDPVSGGLDIYSYLIMPIQRLPRYVLLITEIIKNTPEDHPDYAELQSVLSEMKALTDEFNNAPKLHEQKVQRTREVIRSFEKYKDHCLDGNGRYLVFDSDLIRIGSSGNQKREAYFLFNDILVSASYNGISKDSNGKHGKYIIKNKYPLSHLYVTSHTDLDDDPQFQASTFRINFNDATKELILQASSAELKSKWIETLRSTMNELSQFLIQSTTPIKLKKKSRHRSSSLTGGNNSNPESPINSDSETEDEHVTSQTFRNKQKSKSISVSSSGLKRRLRSGSVGSDHRIITPKSPTRVSATDIETGDSLSKKVNLSMSNPGVGKTQYEPTPRTVVQENPPETLGVMRAKSLTKSHTPTVSHSVEKEKSENRDAFLLRSQSSPPLIRKNTAPPGKPVPPLPTTPLTFSVENSPTSTPQDSPPNSCRVVSTNSSCQSTPGTSPLSTPPHSHRSPTGQPRPDILVQRAKSYGVKLSTNQKTTQLTSSSSPPSSPVLEKTIKHHRYSKSDNSAYDIQKLNKIIGQLLPLVVELQKQNQLNDFDERSNRVRSNSEPSPDLRIVHPSPVYDGPTNDSTCTMDRKELEQIFQEMMKPESGLFKDRRIRLNQQSSSKSKLSMSGMECVDWMLAYDVAESRAQAVDIGNMLIDCKFINHITNTHRFEDMLMFYTPSVPSQESSSTELPENK